MVQNNLRIYDFWAGTAGTSLRAAARRRRKEADLVAERIGGWRKRQAILLHTNSDHLRIGLITVVPAKGYHHESCTKKNGRSDIYTQATAVTVRCAAALSRPRATCLKISSPLCSFLLWI